MPSFFLYGNWKSGYASTMLDGSSWLFKSPILPIAAIPHLLIVRLAILFAAPLRLNNTPDITSWIIRTRGITVMAITGVETAAEMISANASAA